jgi:hypothetical protein
MLKSPVGDNAEQASWKVRSNLEVERDDLSIEKAILLKLLCREAKPAASMGPSSAMLLPVTTLLLARRLPL